MMAAMTRAFSFMYELCARAVVVLPCMVVLACVGCATQSYWASEVDPPGLVLPASTLLEVRVVAQEHEDRSHAVNIQSRILYAFGADGSAPDTPEWTLDVTLLPILPGGAWGEEAVCQLEVALSRAGGNQTWRFNVNGYSGSTWVHDRIPTAVEQAIRGLDARLRELMRGSDD